MSTQDYSDDSDNRKQSNVTSEAADEALWDTQFAVSQDVLEQLSQEAHEDYLAGHTEDGDGSDGVV